MTIYEFITPTGKTKFLLTYGHVCINEFRRECKSQYNETPSIVNHIYKVDKISIKRDERGKILSRLATSKYSQKHETNSTEMTIGYL